MKTIPVVLALSLAPAVWGATPVPIQIDAARPGAPISPFIYGQFIEHLGRCIYGGIWAEQLEDRKFYFPITAEYAPYKDLQSTPFPVVGASPWEIVGAADGVAMVKDDVFVGEHTPRLRQGAGIRQRDLAVLAGRDHVGYLWAKPLGDRAEIEVALVWGEAPEARVTKTLSFVGGAYSKQAFSFTAGASTDKARLEIRARQGDVLLGPPSLMPADNVSGMRRDTLLLLKQLDAPIYRWPGGNFASGYDWRDGIGDRDRRPPRKNPAWTGVEHNDFGTDEFLAFTREVDTLPMIAVNTGFGDAYSAAQWVEYNNGKANSLAGGWRAQNGHPEPYRVKHWCVGNEMFGPWQLGFMQLHQYVLKHNQVAEAMWKVDKEAVLVGVGDLDGINRANDPEQVKRNITWSHGMLEASARHMNMLSEHFYEGRTPWSQEGRVDLVAHVAKLRSSIRHKAEGHRKLQASLPNLEGRTMPIAMDEWNYWHRDYVYGELGCVYDLADALGVAAGLHEYYRQSDLIQMAHYAQTVNVIGAIKTTKTEAEIEATGLVLQLYRAQYGSIPLQLEKAPEPLDVAAALTEDRKTLTVSVVNPTEAPVQVQLAPAGVRLADRATRFHITGASPLAHNAPGQPRGVDIHREDGLDTSKPMTVPALSCALFAIPVAN
jgi:alpha-L-arabinofuranosidase